MESANIVVLGGNLARDPEYYQGSEGKDVIGRWTFPLIVDSPLPNGDKVSSKFNVIAWGKVGEYLSKKVQKGTFLVLQGSLHARTHVDSTGRTNYTTEVKVERVISTRAPRNREEN